MLHTRAAAIFALMFAGLAYAADATDSLTGLPVPDTGSGMKFYVPPITLKPAQVCKSTKTTNFYTVDGFKTSAAIAWYSAHLKGYQRVHGYGAGRSQDLFVNADGSQYVSITGSPAAEGVDTATYAVSYATLKPGLPQKVLLGLLSGNGGC